MKHTVKVVSTSGLPLPKYSTAGAAGMDVCAAHDYTIQLGETDVVMTGLHVELPKGYELQVRSRSGLALKRGVRVANGIGTIDEDYCGEIGVILTNHGGRDFVECFHIKRGDRIAQLVLSKVDHVAWEEVDTLDETERGSGGFGSTGI